MYEGGAVRNVLAWHTAVPVRQSSSLAPGSNTAANAAQRSSPEEPGAQCIAAALSIAPPCSLYSRLLTPVDSCDGKRNFPRSCSPVGKFVRKITALPVFNIFKQRKLCSSG